MDGRSGIYDIYIHVYVCAYIHTLGKAIEHSVLGTFRLYIYICMYVRMYMHMYTRPTNMYMFAILIEKGKM